MLDGNDSCAQTYFCGRVFRIERREVNFAASDALHGRITRDGRRNQSLHHEPRDRGISARKHLHRFALSFVWMEKVCRVVAVSGERIGSEARTSAQIGREKCPDKFPREVVLPDVMLFKRYGIEVARYVV